jgi:hypothetical protein
MRDGQARWLEWLTPVANLPRGWPSFFWKLTPEDLSTEWPFALHVLAWIGVFVAAWLVLRRVWRESTALAIWWLPIAMTAAVATGWRLNGVNGLDPARSQLSVLTAIAHGRAGLRLGTMSITALTKEDAAREVVLAGDEPGRTASPPWLALSGVPAGTYELRFLTSRPRQGEVAIRVGRAARPLRMLPLAPLNDQRQRLSLPAGAATLTIEPDDALRGVAGRVEASPIVIDSSINAAPSRLALSATEYGSAEVFFVDDAVFVESAGFWVRGGGSTEFVIATRAPSAAVELLLRNGAAPNQVSIEADRQSRRLVMSAGEETPVTFTVADPAGVLRVRVTATGGFRPSAVSDSRDGRYLGVWVQIQ